MRYSNPVVGTSTTPPDENRESIRLIVIVVLLVVAVIGAAALLADWLAPHIPFSAERKIAETVGDVMVSTEPAPKEREIEARLQALADGLVETMELPEGGVVTVHYVDQPVVNAMATLGGHLFVYRGMIERCGSEDALAAVIAHEIGHVAGRHVMKAMGRGLMIVAALGAMGLHSDRMAHMVIGQGEQLSSLSYSRDAEREADIAALMAIHARYGHVGGVFDLFAIIADEGRGGLEMTKSHPHPETRREELRKLAAELGYVEKDQRRSLPEALLLDSPE